jgi:Cu/Ag efflux pump CusA
MRGLVGASLRSKGLVVALGIGTMLLGIVQLRAMPRDVLPEFRPPTVEVQTEALGLSANEVEQLITVPLEQDLLNGVAFLDTIHSESLPGLSRIEMVFEPGTDLAHARQVVNERLTQAHALPNVSRPPQMLQPLSSTSRLMMVGLTSDTESLIDLGLLARWTIRPRLMGVPGVANVAIWGQREQQLQVQIDPARLQDADVSLEQIVSTTGNALWASPLSFLEASTPGAGGFFDTSTQRIGVEHTQPIITPDDLAKVPIEDAVAPTDSSAPFPRLGDVANVVEDHQPLIGDAVLRDGPGLLVVVEKFPGANTVDVTRDLDAAIESLEPGLSGVDLDVSFFRPADYIEDANRNLGTAMTIGGVLILIALGALMFGLRSVFVSGIAVLLSLAAAVTVLAFRGETLNAMVLAGLVLALVVLVDDAVVGAVAMRGEKSVESATDAVVSAHGPLGYATVILLLSLVPVLVLTGETGAFLPRLAISYAMAIIASLVVGLTVAPALSLLLRSKSDKAPTESAVLGKLRPLYDKALVRFVSRARVGLGVAGLLLLISLLMFPTIDRADSVVPEFKDRDLLISLQSEPGTSLAEMTRRTADVAEALRNLDGVGAVGGHVGRAVLGDQTVNVNSSELWVSLDGDVDYGSALERVDSVVDSAREVRGAVLTYPRERINDVLKTPDGVDGRDLTIRVYGFNPDTVREAADQVLGEISSIDGVVSPQVEAIEVQPTVQVEVDLDRAQALGISPGQVRRTAATMLAGIEVGSLFHDQKIFEVVVWGAPATRDSLESLRQLPIALPDDADSAAAVDGTTRGQVALEEVADVTMIDAPSVIRHEDISRYLDIGLDVSGRNVDAVAGDIADRMQSIAFPLEYHAEVLGEYASQHDSRVTFIGTTIAVVIACFLVLQSALSSWKLSGLLFVALPGAAAGGVLATIIAGDSLSIGSIFGFFGVLAFAVRGTILLVRRAQALEDQGHPFGNALIERVARERFAAAVTAAVAIVAVLLPLVFSAEQAGSEIASPMAAVLIGGLFTAVPFVLLVVPSLLLRFGIRPPGNEMSDLFGLPPGGEAPALTDELEPTNG